MKKALAALTTLALALGGCSGSDTLNRDKSSVENPTSSLQMNLTLPGGVTINTVSYTVSGPAARNGTINVTNSSVLRFRVGSLPVANGYTMALGGTTTAGQSCAGSAGFNITDNLVTTMTMTLTCGAGVVYEVDANGDVSVSVDVVNNAGVTCPVVSGISALPLETAVGSSLALEGFVTSTTGATLAWTGTGGTFAAASAAATGFTCTSAGDKTLTFAVSKPTCTASSQNVVVTCTGTSVVDSGVDSGPADSGPADSGPADSGPADSGPADSGPADSGPADSGPGIDPCKACLSAAASPCRDFQGSGFDTYANCYENPDPAFAQKCVDAYECSVQAPDLCAGDLTRGPVSCYCGLNKSIDDCFAAVGGSNANAGPAGACIAKWEIAAGCAPGNNSCVSNNFVALSLPSGGANFLTSCAVSDCASACTLPRPVSHTVIPQ